MSEVTGNGRQDVDTIEPIYEELAERFMGADRYYVPRIVKALVSLEAAGMMRELPSPVEEIARKLNLAAEKVQTALDDCVKKGICVRKPNGEIMQSMTVVMIGDLGSINPHVAHLFPEEYFELTAGLMQDKKNLAAMAELEKAQMEGMNEGRPLHRVVPKWRSIKNVPGVMPSENMRELLKPYDGRLSATQCACRRLMNERGCAVNDGTHPDEGLCIRFGSAADYLVGEGVGNYLSSDAVLKNLDRLDISPAYHMIDNVRDTKFVCNCCSCCCCVLKPRVIEGVRLKDHLSPSRFLCEVSKKKCKGCGICITKCPFEAIATKGNGKGAVVDAEKCMGCGNCVINCPEKAMKMKIVRPPEHIPEIGVYTTNDFFDALKE
jgi:NAD-dependent dihydropyrimidine dehydrogenase PreA subunit